MPAKLRFYPDIFLSTAHALVKVETPFSSLQGKLKALKPFPEIGEFEKARIKLQPMTEWSKSKVNKLGSSNWGGGKGARTDKIGLTQEAKVVVVYN